MEGERKKEAVKNSITAKRLRSAMEQKGLRAQSLSLQSGVGKASISQYLSGAHAPSSLSARKMAAVLDVSPLWLMGFDVPMLGQYEAEHLESSDLLPSEQHLIKMYRFISDDAKDRIISAVEKEYGQKRENS